MITNNEAKEKLLYEIVYPAKSKLGNDDEFILMRANYRFRRPNEKSIDDWTDLFGSRKVLEEALEELVHEHIGEQYGINYTIYSGYLGVTSDRCFVMVKHSPPPEAFS